MQERLNQIVDRFPLRAETAFAVFLALAFALSFLGCQRTERLQLASDPQYTLSQMNIVLHDQSPGREVREGRVSSLPDIKITAESDVPDQWKLAVQRWATVYCADEMGDQSVQLQIFLDDSTESSIGANSASARRDLSFPRVRVLAGQKVNQREAIVSPFGTRDQFDQCLQLKTDLDSCRRSSLAADSKETCSALFAELSFH